MIHKEIKKEIDHRGWSISRLASETGIRYPSLTEWFKGNKELSTINLDKILNTLKMEVSVIFKPEMLLAKSAQLGSIYVGGFSDESVMFKKTGRKIYQDLYDTVKNPLILKHLHNNGHLELVKINGFKSWNSVFSEMPVDYYSTKEVVEENGKLFICIGKNELIITEEEFKEKVNSAWENNISTDFSVYYKRVD